MTDLQARAEAAADAVFSEELTRQSLRVGVPPRSTESPGMWRDRVRRAAIAQALHALQFEGWRPGDRAICSVDGHEHEVTILGKHEAHWTVDFGAFKAHVVEHRLRLPTPPEGETP